MPTHSSFLDSYFEAAKQSQDRARFDAEQAMHMHDLQQHMQQFQQSQDLQEREFKQRQQYQDMLGQQAKQARTDLQNQRADTYLDQFRKEGGLVQDRPQAQEITSTAQPMQPQGLVNQLGPGAQGPNAAPLFQQLLSRQVPQLPITMQVAPEAQMRPGYEEQPTPSFVPQGRPDLAGKQFIAPTAEEKARQMAAGKMEEGKELWPTLAQSQYDANPEIWTALGVKPTEKYDPKIQEGLLTHFLTKNKPGEGLQDKWKMFASAKAKEKGVSPEDLTSADLADVAKHVADDSQTSTAAILGALGIQAKQEKEAAKAKAGQEFGEQLIHDPKAKWPNDLETHEAVNDYLMKTYGVHAPSGLNQRAEGNETFARRAIQSVNTVKAMLSDPNFANIIERRGGPGWGRVGNLEQAIGKGFNMTPDEETKIQEFRSGLNYLRFQEGQSLFGGRIPIQLMAELSSTSPRAEQSRATLRGALNGVKKNAEDSLIAYTRERFGGKVPEPFWEDNDIAKRDVNEKEVPSVPERFKNLERGEQQVVTDSKGNRVILHRKENGKFYQRDVQ